jgi:hypothetical protein
LKSDPTFDRRRFLRVTTDQLVAIGRLDDREGLAHALDLSMGGIRFQCVGLDAKPGEILKVVLTLREDTRTLIGQITRAEKLDEFTQEVALCFVKMDDDTRRYLEENLPMDDADGWRDERRTYTRVRLESVVSVARANLIDVVAQARDLSLGGIRFGIEGMELELGDVLRVTIELGGATMNVIGQLVRLTDIDDFRQEAALAFLDVAPETLELMREHLPKEFELDD